LINGIQKAGRQIPGGRKRSDNLLTRLFLLLGLFVKRMKQEIELIKKEP